MSAKRIIIIAGQASSIRTPITIITQPIRGLIVYYLSTPECSLPVRPNGRGDGGRLCAIDDGGFEAQDNGDIWYDRSPALTVFHGHRAQQPRS